jgi:hypothetical protein
VAFSDLYRRLESLGGTPAAAPERAPEPKLSASLAELKRYCVGQYAAGNERAGAVLLAAREAEKQGRGAAFLRQANLSQVNRCQHPHGGGAEDFGRGRARFHDQLGAGGDSPGTLSKIAPHGRLHHAEQGRGVTCSAAP